MNLLLKFKRVYRQRAPCARVLEDLRPLASAGRRRSWARSQVNRPWVTGAPIFSVLFLFLVCGLVAGVGLSPIWIAGALGVVVLGFLLGMLPYFDLPLLNRVEDGHGLDVRRHELVTQVVALLQTDIAPEERLNVQLDLRAGKQPGKLTGTRQAPKGWEVKHYVDPWLHLEGRLLDGTYFRLDMTERVDERVRWKQSGRRPKQKYKRDSDAIVRLRLRVKPERYAHLPRIGKQAQKAVRLPRGARIKSLRVEADRLDLTVRVEVLWRVLSDTFWVPTWGIGGMKESDEFRSNSLLGDQLVAMMFLSLFQILQLSRALDKKARRSKPPA